MFQTTFQLPLRPALIEIKACKDYRDERDLFIHIDEILRLSNLEQDFIELSIQQKQLEVEKMAAAQIERFCLSCRMALRGNIARLIKNLPHREFCKLLADSHLLRWFVGIESIDGVKAYAKSTSDRFAHWLPEEGLQHINARLIHLLTHAEQGEGLNLGLAASPDFENIYFDSTCLKADIHYPVDWVLLRDLTRTLMKATLIIRREGLKHRMPQEPLAFLSDMNTLVMKMTATSWVKDGRKKRKAVLREMKTLAKRITRHARHARNHLDLLEKHAHLTDLSPGRINNFKARLETILAQVEPAIKQAHDRIIGGRKLENQDKILSLYGPDINVLVRGKANATVEFGNKLWLGETREGLIVDYLLERHQTSDSKHVLPAVERLTTEHQLPIRKVWGDRGLDSKTNAKKLGDLGIYNGLCPKNVIQLQERLQQEPELRVGLKRRAGTEARISILTANFMGDKPRAKGFENRQMMVSWAVLAHNLWVLARLPRKPPDEQSQAA